MSERPKVGDRVRVVLEGAVLADDKSGGLPFKVYLEGPDVDLWIPEGAVNPINDEQPTAEQPYRVTPDEVAHALGRTLMETEWSQWLSYSSQWREDMHRRIALPSFVKWRHEVFGPADITGSDRSDTALERRLVALEQDLRHWSTNSQERLAELERGFAHLGNMHVEAEKRYGRDIPELQRRTQYIAEEKRAEPRLAELERRADALYAAQRAAGKVLKRGA